MRTVESGSWIRDDDPGEPSTGRPRLSVTDLEASILSALVIGKTVMEIGTGLGVSTRALAKTARVVHTVDIDPWVQAEVWPDLPSNVVTHKRVEDVPNVEVAFIDGDHSTAQTARDVNEAEARAGLLIIHDALAQSVYEGFGEGWHVIPTVHGIGVRINDK